MPFYIEKIIIHNRAPFGHLELNFRDKGISLLTSINGGGKTTILSHIVDAWYEIIRKAFPSEFEGKEGKYYRIESGLYALDRNMPSIVYIRFKNDDRALDCLNLKGKCSEEQYDRVIGLEGKISYSQIKTGIMEDETAKYVSVNNKKELREIFNQNVITYFPAYRYEEPGYLTDPFEVNLQFNTKMSYSGYLTNPIEVISGLPDLANWILDLLLDVGMGNSSNIVKETFANINQVFSRTLSGKTSQDARLGVGPRSYGISRIQVVSINQEREQEKILYPSIFDMSSGENAIICLFGELIRQFDNIMPNRTIENACGIVLIDEVDKHLHIKLQKEILPQLFRLFPNIQFIISSHSPFVAMGLAEVLQDETSIIDLDCNGVSVKPEENSQYQEVYKMMVEENQRYYNELQKLTKSIEEDSKLLIVSEGDNKEHIKKAIDLRAPELQGKVRYFEGINNMTGVDQLIAMYEAELCRGGMSKVLFIWDCDASKKIKKISEENNRVFKLCLQKNTKDYKAKKGIENLYPEEVFTEEVYRKKKVEGSYGDDFEKPEFDKKGFLSKVKNIDDKDIFKNFDQIINKIKEILK